MQVQVRCVSAAEIGVRLRTPPKSVLYAAGTVPSGPRLAIVGSRAALHRLRRLVPAIVQAAAGEGWAIVSGGAKGIDADAHRAALRSGAKQIAVLPGPAGSPYPPEHAPLFDRILGAGGGLVFPHSPESRYSRGMFASRNRIVVGLADRVVVVQAALRSGTMYTARLARAEHRPLAALAGSPGAAACVSTGALCLGTAHDPPIDIGHRVARWLQGKPAAEPNAWPEEFTPLRAALRAAGSVGVAADDFANPLEGILLLTRAEAARLILEVSPGRYVAR